MYLDDDGIHRFEAGQNVATAAKTAWHAAQLIELGSGRSIRAEFNGTPMDAYPSDECAQVVGLRWHYGTSGPGPTDVRVGRLMMGWFRRGSDRRGATAPLPAFGDTEAQRLLGDLRGVGAAKPLGFLGYDVIEACGSSPEQEVRVAESRGLFVRRSDDVPAKRGAHRPTVGPALYVADLDAVGRVLARHRDTLEVAGWPAESAGFVDRVAVEVAPGGTPLFDVVADTFADYGNPGRTAASHDAERDASLYADDVAIAAEAVRVVEHWNRPDPVDRSLVPEEARPHLGLSDAELAAAVREQQEQISILDDQLGSTPESGRTVSAARDRMEAAAQAAMEQERRAAEVRLQELSDEQVWRIEQPGLRPPDRSERLVEQAEEAAQVPTSPEDLTLEMAQQAMEQQERGAAAAPRAGARARAPVAPMSYVEQACKIHAGDLVSFRGAPTVVLSVDLDHGPSGTDRHDTGTVTIVTDDDTVRTLGWVEGVVLLSSLPQP